MIKYDKLLKILKERNITLAQLRSMGMISASAVDKIRNNKSVQVEALFRVCDFLNCKMDDIVEHENYVELDKSVADFGLTESGYGFDILGIKTISDITAPLTIGNLQNKMCEYYTSCKLNRNDCDVIMNFLISKGYDIEISEGVTPDLYHLPKKFSEENRCVEELQIDNFFIWFFERITSDYVESIINEYSKKHPAQYRCLVEYGELNYGCCGVTFVSADEVRDNTSFVYPLNLIYDVLGKDKCDPLWQFEFQIEEFEKAINSRLNPWRRLLLELRYKFNLDNKQILQHFNLPSYETFIWLLEKKYSFILRFLRHPSFVKLIKEEQPGYELHHREYRRCLNGIADKITSKLSLGVSLKNSLSSFYEDHIVEETLNIANTYRDVPNVLVVDMNLTWKTYAVLNKAEIKTLDDLWKAHGKENGLDDIEKSGLKFYGFDDEQIKELMDALSKYSLGDIPVGKVENIINIAERLTIGESDSLIDAIMPNKAIACLLTLNYRTVEKVYADYSSGVLRAKFENLETEENISFEELESAILSFKTGRFKIRRVLLANYWNDYLEEYPDLTLADIRIRYLHESHLDCTPSEIQKYMKDAFVPGQVEFELMQRTRLNDLKWKSENPSRVCKQLDEKKHGRVKCVYATDRGDDFLCGEMLACETLKNDETIYVYFFNRWWNGQLVEINLIDEITSKKMFEAIEFNSNVLNNVDIIDKR